MTITTGRRALLRGALAGAAFAIGPFASLLSAQTTGPVRRIVLCDFVGGWDVLLGFDARDPARTYPGVDLGTDRLARQYQTPIEVRCGGDTALWGAPAAALARHADVATVFRGVNMNTVAHSNARSYINTGLAPRGSSARGSSICTIFAAGGDLSAAGPILPCVAIGTRAYNDSYRREASALRLGRTEDLLPILEGDVRTLPAAMEVLLAGARNDAESCVGPAYSGIQPAAELRLARDRIARIERESFAARFAFDGDSAEMQALRSLYGISSVDGMQPAVRAATAAQLVRTGLSRAVSVRLQEGLDTHANWAGLHPPRLQAGFDALAALITDLRNDDPDLADTTIVAFSEFARTPNLNGTEGRDHWFASSCVVFGGLRPAVYGATNEDDLGLARIDASTGRPVDGEGLQLLPEHVFATLVHAAGLDADAYRVDPLASLVPA